jgi:hypothetical protein
MSTKTKIFGLVSYSIILAVLLVMSYTLIMIFFYNSVQVLEPNKMILTSEIGLTLFAVTFSIYKIKELF